MIAFLCKIQYPLTDNSKEEAITMPLLMQNPKPRIILGAMTFGNDESKGARVTSLDEYNKCLDKFQKEGYNELDTARNYVGGAQEAWSAQAHWKERGLSVATKCYPNEPGNHKPDRIRASLETSLKELGDRLCGYILLTCARSECAI